MEAYWKETGIGYLDTDYYVTHPELGFSATVSAPTTEKARTTFLDYLERNGKAKRSERHILRRNMVVERLKDPNEVSTDVTLHYGYEETHEPLTFQEAGMSHTKPSMLDMPSVEVPTETAQVEQTPQVQVQAQPQRSNMSPIERVAVTGGL